MKKLLSLAAALVLILSMTPGAYAYTEVEVEDYDYYQRFRGQNISINVYNWGEYISDGAEDTLNVNKAFEELTGIKVYYSNFASNEELYAKLKGGGASYDVIIPSDYLISRLIDEKLIQPLDFDNIPNVANLDERYLDPAYDPGARYSVPYMWGYVGVIYNTTMVDADVETWDILWDARYMGEILMFSNPRDAFGIALKRLGYSFNTESEAELREAAESLKQQKSLVQAYVMDEIFDKMEAGEAAIAPYYAGDAIIMIDENPDLAFAVPREGTNLFVDAMCIPTSSAQKQAAEMYINFMSEVEVAIANVEYIGYNTPNAAAFEEMDPEITENPIAYPGDEVLDNAETFQNVESVNALISELWAEVVSSHADFNAWVMPIVLLGAVLLSVGININRSIKRRQRGE